MKHTYIYYVNKLKIKSLKTQFDCLKCYKCRVHYENWIFFYSETKKITLN